MGCGSSVQRCDAEPPLAVGQTQAVKDDELVVKVQLETNDNGSKHSESIVDVYESPELPATRPEKEKAVETTQKKSNSGGENQSGHLIRSLKNVFSNSFRKLREPSDSFTWSSVCPQQLRSPQGLVATEVALQGKRKIGVLFAAHWCVDCERFVLSSVRKMYLALQEQGITDFEIILASGDFDMEEFEHHVADMPWLVVPFNEVKSFHDALEGHVRRQVPKLDVHCQFIMLDQHGKIVCNDVIDGIRRLGCRAYPFTHEHMKNAMDKPSDNQSEKFLQAQKANILASTHEHPASIGTSAVHRPLLANSNGNTSPNGPVLQRQKGAKTIELPPEVSDIGSRSPLRSDNVFFRRKQKGGLLNVDPVQPPAYRPPPYMKPKPAGLLSDADAPHDNADDVEFSLSLSQGSSLASALSAAPTVARSAISATARSEAGAGSGHLQSAEDEVLAAAKSRRWSELLGGSLLAPGVGPVATDEVLGNKRRVALHFAGRWCAKCRQTTRELAKLSQQLAADDDFEVVMVAADATDREFERHCEALQCLAVPLARSAAVYLAMDGVVAAAGSERDAAARRGEPRGEEERLEWRRTHCCLPVLDAAQWQLLCPDARGVLSRRGLAALPDLRLGAAPPPGGGGAGQELWGDGGGESRGLGVLTGGGTAEEEEGEGMLQGLAEELPQLLGPNSPLEYLALVLGVRGEGGGGGEGEARVLRCVGEMKRGLQKAMCGVVVPHAEEEGGEGAAAAAAAQRLAALPLGATPLQLIRQLATGPGRRGGDSEPGRGQLLVLGRERPGRDSSEGGGAGGRWSVVARAAEQAAMAQGVGGFPWADQSAGADLEGWRGSGKVRRIVEEFMAEEEERDASLGLVAPAR